MTPSVPGWISFIRPNIHCRGGRLSSLMSTMLPILIFSVDAWCHLVLTWSWLRWSWCHLFQKCCLSCCKYCQFDNLKLGVDEKSTSGMLVSESCIRKWPGVKAERSFGSLDKGVMGRELSMASTSITWVLNSSKVKSVFPIIRKKWFLNSLTADSHKPPKWGDRGGIKCQFIPSLTSEFFNLLLYSFEVTNSYNSLSSLFAPTKLVPLSE